MSRRSYIFLALIGFGLCLLVASLQHSPGYMDADYYFAGGLRLAQGKGFNELVMWNYLGDPLGLPQPSHAYWMPLTSLVAALGMVTVRSLSFAAGKLGFILLAACVPPLTAALAYSLTDRRDLALAAGCLALFPGFYLAYFPTSDIFGLYMSFGGLFFLLMGSRRAWSAPTWSAAFLGSAGLGALAGGLHLSRADGLLWLPLAGLAAFLLLWRSRRDWMQVTVGVCASLAGYLVVAGPWLLRNLAVFGTPLAPGGSRALWIREYDELFMYPASLLTFDHWYSAGWGAIVKARLWAAGLNLQTALAVQGLVFLAPLIVWGAWRLRQDDRLRIGVIAWLLTLLAMTLVFPYQGARGGFFHSGAALQPLFWALAPVGLDACLAWAGRLRGWNISQARRIFLPSMVGLAFLISIFLAFNRVVGGALATPAWDDGNRRYMALEAALVEMGATPGGVVLVNNAPGFFVASGRPAISIPFGDVETVLTVAERYDGRYLLLEFNQLQGTEDLYTSPGDRPGLLYLGTVQETRLYRFRQP